MLKKLLSGIIFISVIFANSYLFAQPVSKINVNLKEHSIDIPETIQAGSIIFEVVNKGKEVHNFLVKGENIEKQFEKFLRPGESRRMTVKLIPGQYSILCPLSDNAKKGMQKEIYVIKQEEIKITDAVNSPNIDEKAKEKKEISREVKVFKVTNDNSFEYLPEE